MIAVIADDITGAAEIAGIGLRYGMRVSLITEAPEMLPDVDLLVHATDTRQMSEIRAMDETRRVTRRLKRLGCRDIFKKTDSALRGHVIPELDGIMREAGFSRVLYLPENPSKGRVVQHGIYTIDGVNLDQTLFADDPEFPVRTADMKKRFPGIAIIDPDDPWGASGIFAANASDEAEINRHVQKKDDQTLLAGGADLFAAYLRLKGWSEMPAKPFGGLAMRDSIVVCGSTAGAGKLLSEEFDYFKRKTIPLMTMPKEVFEIKKDPRSWFSVLDETYELHHSIALAVGHPVRKNAKVALNLRNIMARAVSSLIDTRLPHELIIEGGATAFTTLGIIGWTDFQLTDEIEPGVVRMALVENPEIHITLKPGSYPWGNRIFQ